MKSQKTNFHLKAVNVVRYLGLTYTLMIISFSLYAQDGNSGITAATTQVKSYFSTTTQLMYAIGSIIAIVGAIKVFKKWSDGEHDD